MPRPTTKNDLMTVAKGNYEKLNLLNQVVLMLWMVPQGREKYNVIYFLYHGDNFLKQ